MIYIVILVIALLVIYTIKSRNFIKESDKFNEVISEITAQKNYFLKKYTEEKSRSKSVEVRMGQLTEKMAPILGIFPKDPSNAHHLGSPIDYILFDDDEIVFIEVKSGKSRLTAKQRKIKNLVESGQVRFELIRFNENS